MWPFAKKEPKPKKSEPIPPVAIGERFQYLGIDMVCTRHFAWPYEFPVVVCDYVSDLGEIKHAMFSPADWASLEAERARSPGKCQHREPC